MGLWLDTRFYYGFLLLPPRKRNALVAVWNFCRAIDNSVDGDDRTRARTELSRWRHEVEAVFLGRPSTWPGRRLQSHVRHFRLSRAPFEAILDGAEMKLDRQRFESFAELSEYCRRVAASVGLLSIEVFGYQNPAARSYAASLGVALQLTHIIRDLAEDLDRGRLYLPLEDLRQFAVRETDLHAGVVTPAVAALLKFECDRARAYFERAVRELPHEEARALVAAEILGGIYYNVLERIEQADYNVFTNRIRVPRVHRLAIAFRIWLRRLLA